MEDDTQSPLIATLGEQRYNRLTAEAHDYLYVSVPCVIPDCTDRNSPWASVLPICMNHMAQAHRDYAGWVQGHVLIDENRIVYDDAGRTLDDTRPSPSQTAHHVHALTYQQLDKPKPTPAVYYVRMGQRVKIGYSTQLKNRLASFYAQPEDLLAVEPGGREREGQRHQEFAHLRVPRTELFAIDDKLQAHIDLVRSTFGDPIQFI